MNVVVAGTGLNRTASEFAYAPLCRPLKAPVVSLAACGMADPKTSAKNLLRSLKEKSNLVGHSQGGLVAALAASMAPEMVQSLVLLAAPLQGTRLANRFLPFPGLRAMCPSGMKITPHPNTVTIVATRDRTVIPYTSGVVPGFPNYEIDCGHVEIIFRHEVITLVKEICDGTHESASMPA